MTNRHQLRARVRDRTTSKRLALLLTALFVAGMTTFTGGQARANHAPYAIGDVFASVFHTDSGTGIQHGFVRRYSSAGVLLETLDTGSTNYTATGSCFDGTGQLRVTNFADDSVTLFGAPGTGTRTYPWASGISTDPESCRVENVLSGNVFVGVADGSGDVRKFSPTGTLLTTYNVATENRGSDWVDLLPSDNCQLYYTSEGTLVKRFNVCTNTQMADFATGLGVGGACYAVRVRTDGHVFVACTDRVWHLDATGTNVTPSPYLRSSLVPPPPTIGAETGTLFAMNLDPDNATLWTGGLETGHIYRINIATGAQVTAFNGFQMGDNENDGLTIFGEIGPPPPQTAAELILTPPTATNPVGTQHCVTATVRDAAAQPLEGVTVVFSVNGTAGNTAVTDANGQAVFCYIGPTTPGVDTIRAFADSNKNGTEDRGEPFGVATKTWVAGAPATLTLSPNADTNTVGSQHCVTATVMDSFGNPTPRITVRFSVTGSVTTSGTGTSPTNAIGQAMFCYTGPALPGSDVITAYADTNNNGAQDRGEPSDTATKVWVLAQSTAGCKVTDGGRITAANGDNATFGSIASVSASGTPSGAQEYQDHGAAADLNVHSTAVLAVVCNGNTASVFGTASINGSGSFNYRIDLTDNATPGVGADKYRIRLSTGYDSGEQTLIGGNIQLHK